MEKFSYEYLENTVTQLTSQLDQRTQELAVINAVQEGLAKRMDMQGIYDLVGDRIRDTFDAQAVIIATFDHEAGIEHFGYAIEKDERFHLKPRTFDKLRQSLIDTKQNILINQNFEEAYRQFGMRVLPGSEFPKSALYVPLIINEKVTGYVSLQNVDKENAFTESNVQLLETIANSMSTALENAHLLKETEQRTAELAVINSVQEALAKEMDIQAIYDLVGNRIRDLFDAQAVGIATFNHANETEHIHYLIEKGERYYPAPRPLNILRKHLIATREKILINKNFEEVAATFGMKQVPGTAQPKSALYVPLVIGERVTGYISLQNVDKENAFNDSDVRLLETLANSMGVALENARLFNETTRLLKETEQQKAELGVINSVQEGLAKELDIQAIYDLVGDRIRKLFNAQAIIIATFDHETATEHFKYAYEDGQRFYLAGRPYDKLRQHLIVSGQKIVINTNYEQAYAKFGLKTLPGTNITKSAVFVPLVIGDKVTSYISLQNNEIENAFSESDVRLLETLANSMSVALENARLFDETSRLLKETEQRTAELAVINSVQEGLARELDMKAIYELVGNKVREVFDAQVVMIATFDHDLGTERFNYIIEKGEQFHPEPRRYDKLRYQLIVTKQKILINSNANDALKEFGLKVIEGTEMPKSLLYVPLVVGNKVTSYVSLQNLDKENAFSESDVRLLETLANSMSVALENARLFDETNRLLKETEQRTAELAVINSVQEGLAKELNIESIYELVGEKIRKIFQAQVIDIVTYDSSKNLLEDRYAFEKGDRTLVGSWEPYGFRKHVIETKEVLVINTDLQKKSMEFDSRVLHGEQPLSALFVPLVSGDEIKGIISLQDLDKENAFSDSDVRLLKTLANSMSVALENARLFDKTNRLLKETEQRNAELAVINSVQESLVAQMDMAAIYELVGEKMRQIFNPQVIDIVTYDSRSNLIEDKYAYEKGDRTLLGLREPKGFRKHVIETGQLLVHNTGVAEAMKAFGNEILFGEMPKSQMYVPMIAGGKVTGVISLQNLDHENAFSDSDVSLLTTLANSMSVALESARLFDETNRLLKETEQRTTELAVINSVQEGLAHELDMQGIYNLVGDRAVKLFKTHAVIIASFDLENGIEHFNYAFENGQKYEFDPRPVNALRRILIEKKQTIYIDTEKKARDEYGITAIADTKMPKSLMFVPLLSSNTIKGYISIQNVDKENAFDEADIRLLETLANSMSVALENARLFDETTRLLAEAKQRATELSTVNNISKALASQLDTDELIQLVGDQMKNLFNANIVYLAILNTKTRMINFAYQYGEEMPSRIIGEGLTSQILLSGEPLLINKDVGKTTSEMGMKIMGKVVASYLGVPIPVGDEIIGVLSVQSTEQENRFNDNDLRLLSTIAASVGVALNNASLFDEVKQAKLEAEAATKAAEKANEAKSAFLSTVSHELRTPLTSVLGFAKIIRKRLDEKIFPSVNTSDPKTQKTIKQISENLNVVVSEGERLTHLINDVLDLAKIEAGKMEWNFEDVFITEVAERAISATTSLFEQKNLTLVKEIDKSIPPVSGDRDKLIQVIINLISNAVKFTDAGTVTCKVHRRKKDLIVSISDTGIGIASEDHAAVFEQFKQVGGDTLTDKPKGTGLGLPICKEIIEHHNGRIWLESEPGMGSTFSFSIPLKVSEPALKKPADFDKLLNQLKEQMTNSVNGLTNKSTILIVDDDDSIRSLLQQEFSEAGYIIQEAVNGKEALESIRNNKPDLIILDVMMPEMNGFDVAAILKNDPETMDIPIIILSIVQDKIRGYKIGVDRYLNKPIDTAQLFTEVGTLLEQGKSKKKVMIVDEDSNAVRTLTDVLETKGYHVVESNGKELMEKAIQNQPDIIILNSADPRQDDLIKTLRFEKGMENVLFLLYQ